MPDIAGRRGVKVRKAIRALAAVAAISASMLTPTLANAQPPQTAGATMWMSADQLALSLHDPALARVNPNDANAMAHALRLAEADALAGGVVTAPDNLPGGGGGGPWYQILLDQHDWAGNDTPTRNGDYTNFGYLKGTVAHNLYTLSAYQAAYSGYPKGSSGGNRLYVAWLVVSGYPACRSTSRRRPAPRACMARPPTGVRWAPSLATAWATPIAPTT